MPKLRYQCEDRFAETNGYEGFQEDKQKLLDIYNRIKPTWKTMDKLVLMMTNSDYKL